MRAEKSVWIVIVGIVFIFLGMMMFSLFPLDFTSYTVYQGFLFFVGAIILPIIFIFTGIGIILQKSWAIKISLFGIPFLLIFFFVIYWLWTTDRGSPRIQEGSFVDFVK